LDLYNKNLEILVRSEVVLATLKKLDPKMEMKPHMADKMGMQDLRVTVEQRMKQVKEDIQIQTNKVKTIEQMLESEPQQSK